MKRRMYQVKLEVRERGGWSQNALAINVVVAGGATAAIKEAERRAFNEYDGQYRAEAVQLLAQED